VDAITRLRVLLVVLLFKELGIDEVRTTELIKRNYHLSSSLG